MGVKSSGVKPRELSSVSLLGSVTSPFSQQNPHPRKYDYELIISDYKKGLSIPQLHVKYGISHACAYSILSQAKVMRNLSQSMLLKYSGKTDEWRRLCRMSPTYNTRILSIPTALLTSLGVNPDKDLVGKWFARNGKLVLEVKESAEVEGALSETKT